jgi:hypothetical protein
VAVLSGGNIDPAQLAAMITAGAGSAAGEDGAAGGEGAGGPRPE